MTLNGIITGNKKIIDKAKDKEGNIKVELNGGITREALDKIWKALQNSNYHGNVHIRFE